MLDQVGTMGHFWEQHIAGGKRGGMVCVRMNLDFIQAVPNGGGGKQSPSSGPGPAWGYSSDYIMEHLSSKAEMYIAFDVYS